MTAETTKSDDAIDLPIDSDLPTDVCDESQLQHLPVECLSGDPAKPLRHVDARGAVSHYELQPMHQSVKCILLVELLERFSFYGVYYTQTLYLTGVYNNNWNAGLSSVQAAALVSTSTAVAYTTPFLGALLADVVLGDYASILVGSLGFYGPGLLLVALTTVPQLLANEFPLGILKTALLFLWPLGTGIIKSVINVFGAKQFHPILQASMIERYYVNFYMVINIGALVGILGIPILAQSNVTVAYCLPAACLALGLAVFLSGTPHYVIGKPQGELFAMRSISVSSRRSRTTTNNKTGPASLAVIFRISLLIVPFCIAYSQMPTTFELQGTVMHKALGVIDAATMNSIDAISVLAFGSLTGNRIYPFLQRRNIRIATTHKFALGSFLAALALLWALLVEYWIHQAYFYKHGAQVSVLWQAPAYLLIGWGEIFAVSAAYEVAFTASAPTKKALASAVNIFCIGGIPNVLCLGLYRSCKNWFRNTTRGDSNLQAVGDYATASVYKYFCVLLGILVLGIGLNLLPSVRQFVEDTERQAANEAVRQTPRSRNSNDEEKATFAVRPASHVGEELDGPILFKMGSMRAGPSLSQRESPDRRRVKKSYIPRLYGSTSNIDV